ncbi:MAG: hypothetical protein QOH69_1542 [Actinomycetota bacterium]|jgi:hypothetical protein|nr:hypothetical protein [Actinomycetota bacterium]
MTPASSNADAIPDGRDETQTERLDRNWSQLVQELRVTQTGTQILTGFLLTLAFQSRFVKLDAVQVQIYLVLVVLAGLTTLLGLTPVAIHRALFRKRAMAQLVATGNVLLKLTLACVGLILTGTTLFIFAVVVSTQAGIIVGAVALVATVALWIFVPFGVRPEHPLADRDHGDSV